jgi:hypothetical protein
MKNNHTIFENYNKKNIKGKEEDDTKMRRE